jgi:hypothetical protein
VRHVSQLHFNQLFSNNKVSIKIIQYSPISMNFSTILLPLLSFSWVFFILSTVVLQMANIRNRNNNNNGATMERTTRTSIRCHPLRLLLSKCWLCKHKCFRLCSRPCSTCKLLKLKRCHHHRGIDLEIFSALSCLPFLMLWSRWMLMIGSSMLRRSCKCCSATTMRRCC